MSNADIALTLLGIAAICLVGAKYFIDQDRKELQNRQCKCKRSPQQDTFTLFPAF